MDKGNNASPKISNKFHHCDLIFAMEKDKESDLHSTEEVCFMDLKKKNLCSSVFIKH